MTHESDQNLGDYLKRARDEKGLSQVALANRSGVSVDWYRKIEGKRAKRVSLEVKEKIFRALDKDIFEGDKELLERFRNKPKERPVKMQIKISRQLNDSLTELSARLGVAPTELVTQFIARGIKNYDENGNDSTIPQANNSVEQPVNQKGTVIFDTAQTFEGLPENTTVSLRVTAIATPRDREPNEPYRK